jgi:hypothetical protein
MKVAVEYIMWLQEEINKINMANLKEIIFFENGVVLEIPKKRIEDYKFMGLNNKDFITTGYYKED